MKPRRIEPIWALAFGYLIAPVVCIVNGLVFSVLFADASGRNFKDTIFYASITILTMILGLATTRLIRIWNGGNCGQARLWSLKCGIVCAALWVWLGSSLLNQPFYPSKIGGLLLPFLWSIGFFLFAFFARPPQT